MTTYYFNKDSYDLQIDFVKGVCILWVILTHCISQEIHDWSLFCLWGDMAVPIFILIQIFHAYKHGYDKCKFSIKKIWSRILRPFFFAQFFIFSIVIITYIGGGQNDIAKFFFAGGLGDGSYYVWIYLQFACILPFLSSFFSKFQNKVVYVFAVFLITSILIELICSFIGFPEFIYRLLCLRYIFLFYLGFVILKKGIVMNKLILAISLFSASIILFFQYSQCNTEPFFFKTGWTIFHWPSYFYVGSLLIWSVLYFYNSLKNKDFIIISTLERMGKYSYEIFIAQMIYYYFVYLFKLYIPSISENIFFIILLIIISPMICVYPVLYYNKTLNDI